MLYCRGHSWRPHRGRISGAFARGRFRLAGSGTHRRERTLAFSLSLSLARAAGALRSHSPAGSPVARATEQHWFDEHTHNRWHTQHARHTHVHRARTTTIRCPPRTSVFRIAERIEHATFGRSFSRESRDQFTVSMMSTMMTTLRTNRHDNCPGWIGTSVNRKEPRMNSFRSRSSSTTVSLDRARGVTWRGKRGKQSANGIGLRVRAARMDHRDPASEHTLVGLSFGAARAAV